MANPFVKDNQFGTPFDLIPAEDECEHLRAIMANVQAYHDHSDVEPVMKDELRGLLASLKETYTLLSSAMSAAPRV